MQRALCSRGVGNREAVSERVAGECYEPLSPPSCQGDCQSEARSLFFARRTGWATMVHCPSKARPKSPKTSTIDHSTIAI